MDSAKGMASALGGSTVARDAAAMRAARLARLCSASTSANPPNSVAESLVSSQLQQQNIEPVSLGMMGGSSNDHQAQVAPPTNSCAEFMSLPEGALLRIVSQLDMTSACSLATAGGAGRGMTALATNALREAIRHAKEEHQAASAAIEQDRAAARARHAAEQTPMAQALAALAPLRNNRAMQRHGEQLQQIFNMLEQGAHGPPPGEAEFETRAAEAAAAMVMLEMAARTHVAAGELHSLEGQLATFDVDDAQSQASH